MGGSEIQSSFGPTRLDVARSERRAPRLAVKKSEMLLTYGVCTSSVQLFNSFSICRVERSEHRNVTWLKLYV